MTGQILPRSGRDDADRPLALDAVDRTILEVLRTDGRISMSNLATAVNLSRAATYMRVNRLTDAGVIEHFSASINSVKAGLPIAALVLVTANHRGQLRWTRWREELSQIPAVEFAFMVTGDTDVVMLIRARDQDEFNWILLEQIQGLEHVGSTRTLLVINEILHRPYVSP
jgi:DNA-binding Lrp family transcriptional regulator